MVNNSRIIICEMEPAKAMAWATIGTENSTIRDIHPERKARPLP